MALLNPEHLFNQADMLAAATPAGAPRQADLRRAVSAAYYGLFHAALAALADEFVGVTQRGTDRYALAYRSVEHRTLRELCEEIRKPTPRPKYARYMPTGGFGPGIAAFASAIIELQERRHDADYDPSLRVNRADAHAAVATARAALDGFVRADGAERRIFLTLLAFPPR